MSHLKTSLWDSLEKLKGRLKQHLYISTLIKCNGSGGVRGYYKTRADLASSCSTLPYMCSALTDTHKVPRCNPVAGRLGAKWMIVTRKDGSEDRTTRLSLPALKDKMLISLFWSGKDIEY